MSCNFYEGGVNLLAIIQLNVELSNGVSSFFNYLDSSKGKQSVPGALFEFSFPIAFWISPVLFLAGHGKYFLKDLNKQYLCLSCIFSAENIYDLTM